LPAFSTRFDLLTTLEPAVLRRLDALPFSRWWRKFLRPMTCFIGTTASEYVLLPSDQTPEQLVGSVRSRLAPRYPFLIIKDLPAEAALVGDAALAYSLRLADACRQAGFVLVEGQALAYVPIDFASTDEYLARLSHARRKNLRRKLRSRDSLQVEAIATGDARFADEEFLATLYALYCNVYEQSEIHFDRLTASFFRAVLQDAGTQGIVFIYRANGTLIGYNLCLRTNGVLIDKYVGFAYPEARDHDLYAVTWFHNIEYALEHGYRHYVAGWTDPEIKRQLGATFTFTMHAVFVRNPILRALLRSFKRLFESDRAWHAAHVPTTHS
jgi:predicted N-acyltransferase